MIVAFVLAAILAAGILKVLGYVSCSWWLIASPLIAWAAFQLLAILIYVLIIFRIKKIKKEIPPRPVPKSGFMKKLEEAQRAQQEAQARKQQRMNDVAD